MDYIIDRVDCRMEEVFGIILGRNIYRDEYNRLRVKIIPIESRKYNWRELEKMNAFEFKGTYKEVK